MKKSAVVLFVLILAVNLISAVDIEIKSSYNPGDTMQVEIPDVFIDNLKIDNQTVYNQQEFSKNRTRKEIYNFKDMTFLKKHRCINL